MHSLTALLALVPFVAAHGHLDSVTSAGKVYPLVGPDWVYNDTPSPSWRGGNQDNGFVDSFAATIASGQIACGKINGTNAKGVALPAKGTPIPAAAGSELTVTWSGWAQHQGPTIDYLAKCPGKCADLKDATTLQWFKIRESGWTPNGAGLSGQDQKWEAVALGKTIGLDQKVTIPANLASGEYVLRHEIVALHGAGSAGGAQLYPNCFNINVSGGGSVVPTGVVSSALYTQNDPSILISIWYPLPSNYVVPGPKFPSQFTNKAKRFQA